MTHLWFPSPFSCFRNVAAVCLELLGRDQTVVLGRSDTVFPRDTGQERHEVVGMRKHVVGSGPAGMSWVVGLLSADDHSLRHDGRPTSDGGIKPIVHSWSAMALNIQCPSGAICCKLRVMPIGPRPHLVDLPTHRFACFTDDLDLILPLFLQLSIPSRVIRWSRIEKGIPLPCLVCQLTQ